MQGRKCCARIHFGSPNDLKTFAKTAGLSADMDLHADDSVILLGLRLPICRLPTHVKISQLVTSLQTSRQQVVHVRTAWYKLSASLEQAVNNL